MRSVSNPHSRTFPPTYTLALLLVCASFVGCKRPPAPAPEAPGGDDSKGPVAVAIADVKTAPAEWLVEAPGVVVPAQGGATHVAAAAPGRLLTVVVREGDVVKAGQLLATLENRPQTAALESARSAAGSAEAISREADITARAAANDQASALRLAQLTLASAKLDRDGAVTAARNQVLAAETDYKKAKNGNRPQEIAQADLAMAQAKATRDRADIELKRTRRLLDAGVAPRRQLEDSQTAFDIAEAAFNSARAQSNLMHAGTRPEDIQAAQIRLDGAREALKQAQTSGDAHIAQADAAVKQAELSALTVQAKISDARAQAETANQKRADLKGAAAAASFTEVRAPIAGIVTRRALNPGDMADTTGTIVEVTGSASVDFAANLTAADASKVKAGLAARIALKAAGLEEPLSAAVSFVGIVDPTTNLAPVRLTLSPSAKGLRVGTFGKASIVLKSNPEAISVPKAAVLSRDGKSSLYVISNDNVAHSREVVTGPENEKTGTIVIESGLKVGEKIAAQGSYELEDGSKIKPVKAEDKKDDGKSAAAPSAGGSK